MTRSQFAAASEIRRTLQDKILRFWLERGVDAKYGGYLTSFDENGEFSGDGEKYIVTQSRMVWGFSHLSRYASAEDRPWMEQAARQGVKFLLEHFWDRSKEGFFWKTDRAGNVLDPAKLVYGQSFALYALSEYYLNFRDEDVLRYAERLFELLQVYAADTRYGGYYENLEGDWSVSESGFKAGDRKSLDIHMHLMEAFSTLYEATGKEIHARKLQESIGILLGRMTNCEKGYGYNQFTLSFDKIPAINICRTWNAERETHETIGAPTDTTSYGHNVEMSWLLDRAYTLLGMEKNLPEVCRLLLDHSLRCGFDYEYGGIYRDGVADREVLVTDKEWWQNFEALVGYLNGYVRFGEDRYYEAFEKTWEFVKTKFMNMEVGESRQLLDRTGAPLVSNMGNPWKAVYHTGRALGECLDRFDKLEEQQRKGCA